MAFRIDRVSTPSGSFELKQKESGDRNRTTIVIGANGTGKSRFLAALVCQFTNKRSQNDDYINGIVATNISGFVSRPKKVIAQTFSPFSRFPREHSTTRRLEQYVSDDDDLYAAIGFTKNYGLYGSVSKDAVGRILRKLYVTPEQASPLGHAMVELGFEPEIQLQYARSPSVSSLTFHEPDHKKLRESVKKSLIEVNQRRSVGPEVNKLRREIGDNPTDQIIDRITDSILTLQRLTPKRAPRRPSLTYELTVNLWDQLDNRTNEALGALVSLTRLGLLRLSDCVITRNVDKEENHLSAEMSTKIDMTDASSGEQQLLSCLFSVVAESRDHSLILIDEPELSLHPAWQTQFLDLLTVVTNQYTGCHIFVATHSPLLAQRALELDFDVLQLGEPSIGRDFSRSKSASVESTLFENFRVPVRGSNYVARLILSLVMKAEETPARANEIEKRLKEIKDIYEVAPIPDKAIMDLVHDALDIVGNMTEQG